ncbi:MAG TPA: MFS transporter [Clostridia bacterium]|nr:MFS transporter [Clostridia bacterium]
MRKRYRLLIFLNTFASGIMAPVLALALLEHGATISTVSLMLGIYSLTVIAAEFPSGVFADLCGRKKAYALSAALYVLSYCVLLFSTTASLLAAAMVLLGLARAFSSGSIDALAMDEAVSSGCEVVKVSAQVSIMENAGLAAGALTGGIISGIGERYAGNLLVNLTVYTLVLVCTILFVHEQPRPCSKARGMLGGFRVQVRESLSFVIQKGKVRMLFVLSILTGFALLSVETYWQPALLKLSPPPFVFGAVSFAGFACVVVGSKLTQFLLTKHPQIGVVAALGFKALFGLSLGLLVTQSESFLFAGVYSLAYLFLGSGSVAESALLNQLAPSKGRASILSLFSFVLQIGGLIASLSGAAMSAYSDYKYMWYLSGSLLLLGAGVFAMVFGKRLLQVRQKTRENELNLTQSEAANAAEDVCEEGNT